MSISWVLSVILDLDLRLSALFVVGRGGIIPRWATGSGSGSGVEGRCEWRVDRSGDVISGG